MLARTQQGVCLAEDNIGVVQRHLTRFHERISASDLSVPSVRELGIVAALAVELREQCIRELFAFRFCQGIA